MEWYRGVAAARTVGDLHFHLTTLEKMIKLNLPRKVWVTVGAEQPALWVEDAVCTQHRV